jgi:hypothetical protein
MQWLADFYECVFSYTMVSKKGTDGNRSHTASERWLQEPAQHLGHKTLTSVLEKMEKVHKRWIGEKSFISN